ncbi:MAG: NmrA family NAD(P)-binding protein, partial [Bacteroidota bacterium]
MKVLVTGATGSQAKPVVFELLKHGHEVVAMTRDASKASDLREAGAEIFEG